MISHTQPLLRNPNRLIAPILESRRRKGAAIVLAVVLMFALFSFLAFSIDTGYVAQSLAEMRRTADAAAMAGCWELHTHLVAGQTKEEASADIRQEAANFAGSNPVNLLSPSLDTDAGTQDIQIGFLSSLQSTTLTNNPDDPFYAVRVNVTKNEFKNGQIPFFFGKIFGLEGRNMEVSATAIMTRNISGFKLPPGSKSTIDLLPFTLDLQTWSDLKNGVATDEFEYDPETGNVSPGSDGILEVNLYPQGTGAPGNRGTVDIGGNANSTRDIERQILFGISAEDLEDLGEPLVLDGSGRRTLRGDTGISAGVKDELNSIVGQERMIPIFSDVTGNGNNAIYTIVKWVGIRIMYVKLTGAMTSKRVVVQPSSMLCPYTVVANNGYQNSEFILSPVMLAR